MTTNAANPGADPRAFRDFEHAGWTEVAGGYHGHFATLTSQALPVLLDAAGIGAGTGALDVCTGPGYAAAAATERGAQVTGMDFSSPMILTARRNYAKPQFLVGDAE